jgi:hypothetical protein
MVCFSHRIQEQRFPFVSTKLDRHTSLMSKDVELNRMQHSVHRIAMIIVGIQMRNLLRNEARAIIWND